MLKGNYLFPDVVPDDGSCRVLMRCHDGSRQRWGMEFSRLPSFRLSSFKVRHKLWLELTWWTWPRYQQSTINGHMQMWLIFVLPPPQVQKHPPSPPLTMTHHHHNNNNNNISTVTRQHAATTTTTSSSLTCQHMLMVFFFFAFFCFTKVYN